MVKLLFSFFLLFTSLHAEKLESTTQDPLIAKIKSFLDAGKYESNKEFIDVIFDPKESYYSNQRVDSVKVVQTLKENGLLKLFFNSPREFKLNFKTSGAPLFFVKLMSDALRNIGYYRYVTTASNLDVSEFIWNIVLTSEYATDPLVLDEELKKSGCKIIDIQRNEVAEWTYVIDISSGFLNVETLSSGEDIKLKRSLYSHWLDVSNIKALTIRSSKNNDWYPYIAYYDASLHLLKVLREDEIYRKIELDIPENSKYIKISDLYTLKNVKDELILQPGSSR